MMKSKVLFLKKSSLYKLNSLTGFTLAELMVAALILITILVGLLASYVTCFDLNETSKNFTLAMDAINQKMAEVSDYSFSNICSNFGISNSTFTLSDSDFQLMPAGDSRGNIYVYPYTTSSISSACASGCTCDYTMLRVVISVCWRQKSGRVIGEDKDLDGVLDSGEDTNGNNQIDSPAQLVTFLTAS